MEALCSSNPIGQVGTGTGYPVNDSDDGAGGPGQLVQVGLGKDPVKNIKHYLSRLTAEASPVLVGLEASTGDTPHSSRRDPPATRLLGFPGSAHRGCLSAVVYIVGWATGFVMDVGALAVAVEEHGDPLPGRRDRCWPLVAEEIGAPPCQFVGRNCQVHLREASGEGAEDDLQLHPGERGAEAVVDAVTEGQMGVVGPGNVKTALRDEAWGAVRDLGHP